MTDVYRFFDPTETLLYVGITDDLPARLAAHARDKPWWSDVCTITIERYEKRLHAEIAEQLAVREERPLQNKALANRPAAKRAYDQGAAPMGRPPVDHPRTEVARFRLTAEEAVAVQRAADLAGQSVTDYARDALLNRAKRQR